LLVHPNPQENQTFIGAYDEVNDFTLIALRDSKTNNTFFSLGS
jgi:hypothetical protein